MGVSIKMLGHGFRDIAIDGRVIATAMFSKTLCRGFVTDKRTGEKSEVRAFSSSAFNNQLRKKYGEI